MAVTVDDSFVQPPDDGSGDGTTDATQNEGAAANGALPGAGEVSTPDPTVAAAADPNDPTNRTGGVTLPGAPTSNLNTPPSDVMMNTEAATQALGQQGQPAPSEVAGAANVPGFVDTRGLLPGQQAANVSAGGGAASTPLGTGGTDLAAGPGWEVNARGQFSSTNTPDYIRQQQGFTGNGVGPNTIVAGGTPTGTTGEGLGLYGSGVGANGKTINTADFGPQPMQGGLYGSFVPGGVPSGGGVNMAWFGDRTGSQTAWNTANGQPPLGGGSGVNAGPAAYAGLPGASRTAPSAPIGGPPPGSPAAIAAAGGTATAGTGIAPASGDTWQQQFQKNFGFYDPAYNSEANFLQNALRGDAVIRGAGIPGGQGPDELAVMAKTNPDAAATLAAINGAPNFYGSQNAADWAQAHDTQIANQIAQGGPGAANVVGQRVNIPANPVDNAHALVTQTLADQVTQALTGNGATNVQFGFDPYGNLKLTWTSASGVPNSADATLVGMAGTLSALRDKIAAAAPPTGGGGAPRGSAPSPPRGAGASRTGGYVPPAAPTPPNPATDGSSYFGNPATDPNIASVGPFAAPNHNAAGYNY